MAKTTKAGNSAQVRRLQDALAREKEKSAALANERADALAQQAAAAEILKVIRRSPSDAQPVFDAIVRRAMRLIGGHSAMVTRVVDGMLHLAALTSTSKAGDAALRKRFPRPLSETSTQTIVIHSRVPYVVPDTEKAARSQLAEMARARGYRSMLLVPMLRDGVAIGAISTTRKEPGPFTKRQIDLLKTFADQAVIAIENVRRFTEAKEALDRQTATSEVLKTISRSTFDLNAVLRVLIENATRLAGAHQGFIFRFDGEVARLACSYNAPADYAALISVNPIAPGRGALVARTLLERRPVHIPDALEDKEFNWHEAQRLGGFRSMLGVPMMREGKLIGVIAIWSTEVRPFTEKQIELVSTFADQAVIAIENVRLFNETKGALERQTATADVLRAISTSPTDTQPVFDTILERAARLCNANSGILFRHHDGAFHALAKRIPNPEFAALFREPRRPSPNSKNGLAQLARLKRVVHIPDMLTDEATLEKDPLRLETVKGGMRTWLGVPLLKDGQLAGAIVIYRSEPQPFSPAQIALVETFAEQAVIAIENVRLFNETKEALERQTATAEILRVIAGSPSDVKPVFDAIAESAHRLLGGLFTVVARREGDTLHLAAHTAASASGDRLLRGLFPTRITGEGVMGKAIVTGEPVCVGDIETDPAYSEGFRKGARKLGVRGMVTVPMLREGESIGVIAVSLARAGTIAEHQTNLLKAFADQAVIAIENVRLFNETKEALERQTATAEILKVISASPTEVRPVLEAVASSAARLCEAKDVAVCLKEGDQLRYLAHQGEIATGAPLGETKKITKDWTAGRAALEARQIHIPDILAEDGEMGEGARMGKQAGYRTVFATPLLRHGVVVGVIVMRRAEVRPFEARQIELINTFADQAVIAIENVRLFNETKEALERQTATAEILKVISGSPTDIQPVLDAVSENAARLCEANNAVIFRLEGDLLRQVAAYGGLATSSHPTEGLPVNRGRVTGRAVFDRRTIHVHDLAAETSDFPEGSSDARRDGHRTTLATPLLREGVPIGAILIRRTEVRPFSDKQIALLQTFADQAVIAIENVRLFNETKESLERQTATAEILKVIASSPSDVQPVFDAIAASAKRLLGGDAALVNRRVGDMLELAAFTSVGEAADAALRQLFPSKITGKGHMGKAILSAAPVLIDDIETDPNYSQDFKASARTRSLRSIVTVPMLREGEAIGGISVNRSIPGRFSDHQTNLLKTFADQAVIAIENVRLFNETQEALARQEAAAQVLRSISESVSDTAPVFAAILDCCNRLIPTIDYVQVQLIEGSDRVRLVDHRFGQVRGAAPGKQDERRAELMAREAVHFPRPLAGSTLERALNQGRVVILADTLDGPDTPPGTLVEARRWGHSYSQITVPLMREGRCIGAIEAFRRQLGGFEAKESSLLESFADQAVIAIENARLFNETKESLERQTATAEILNVISKSPTDERPVFEAILENAVRLCNSLQAAVFRFDGRLVHLVATKNWSAEALEKFATGYPSPPDPRLMSGRVILTGKVAQIEDARTDPSYASSRADVGGWRRLLGIPILREGTPVGAISVTWPDPGKTPDHQIELLKTFADQAVIAIENVRLFKELEARTSALGESVQKLTALGEVGQAISSTLDLETVLKTIASHAVQLTGLDGASIYEYDEAAAEFRLQVAHNFDPGFLQAIRNAPIRKGDGTVGRVAITLEPAQVTDILDDSYHSSRKELLVGAGYRAVLTVPLLREDHIIGALSVTRKTPGPFADEIVELLKTFATQSAMAIQNARLFREIAEKGKQLEEASRHKSQFLASMSHELRTPLNAILGFNEMILGDIYGEVPGDMKEPLTDIQTSGKHLLRLINNVLDLAKIEAGRMELALDTYSVHDTVESVRSTLRPLAEAKGLELAVDVPSDIPLAHGDGGRITQCLMNLAGNSLKFTKQGRVGISVVLSNGTLTYCVRDTGIGIPPDKIGSLFTEFKQTDATIASEYGGTGLGLSITKKFIEMHGGRIWAESEPGSGSTFIFEIPLRAEERGDA